MSVTNKEVDRLAELAKLEFSEAEKETIVEDLNKILDFVGQLNELDTTGLEPLLFMTDEVNALRSDEPRVEITQKEALKNAPQKDSDYFKIPKVLKK